MCTFLRTANAGGLLTLDSVQILLDGVSQAVGDYVATPDDMEAVLLETPLDLMAFTHDHDDHFSDRFVRCYGRIRPLPTLLGPETVSTVLAGCSVLNEEIQVGSVRVMPIPSRHMGDTQRKSRQQKCDVIMRIKG